MNKEFIKYPSIPYLDDYPKILDDRGYVFEKIDGSLSQIRKINREIVCGSKSNYLQGKILDKTPWFSDFVGWAHSNPSLFNIPTNEDFIIFGEWLEPTTLNYSQDKLNKFYFTDLAYVNGNKPILYDYEESVRYLRKWDINGIEILDPIAVGNFNDSSLRTIIENYPSSLGAEQMEGIVFKNYERQEFVKALSSKFSEIRKEQQGLERYLNNVRVRKSKKRLQDAGIKEPTPQELVDEIRKDIFKEAKQSFSLEAIHGLMRIRNLLYR